MEEDKFRLRVNISIEGMGSRNYGNLNLTEDVVFDGIGFLQMCKVLGEFHTLALKFRKEKEEG